MAKKSDYMKELERQYKEKHILKLKLKKELKALKKRKTLPKKKDLSFPMLKHPKKKVAGVSDTPKPKKKSLFGSLFKRKRKVRKPKKKSWLKRLFKKKKVKKVVKKKSRLGSLFKKKKASKPEKFAAPKMVESDYADMIFGGAEFLFTKKKKKPKIELKDVPSPKVRKPKKKSWLKKLFKRKVKQKPKPKKKSWLSSLFKKKSKPKEVKKKPVKKVVKKKSWLSSLFKKKSKPKEVKKKPVKKVVKKKSWLSSLFKKKSKPKEVVKTMPKEKLKKSFLGSLFEKKKPVKEDVKTKKLPRHIDVPKNRKIRKSLVDKFLVKEKKPVEDKPLLESFVNKFKFKKSVKPKVNEKKFIAHLKNKLDQEEVEDKLDYLANNPDPRVRAYNLINACWKCVKRKKISKAEFYYEQIKPVYEKLTLHEKEHMFNDLVQLQNALVMLRMKLTKDKLRRRR